jgi:hypothetical protein
MKVAPCKGGETENTALVVATRLAHDTCRTGYGEEETKAENWMLPVLERSVDLPCFEPRDLDMGVCIIAGRQAKQALTDFNFERLEQGTTSSNYRWRASW